MKRNGKQIALVLVLSLLLGLLGGCGENTATTIHLEKTQGTVGVEDEKDTRIQVRDGMQLYSGYEVGTADASQAWISLDSTKSLKMDALTVAEVSQSGKNLKVTLQEGKLFFHVSQPLGEDESFTIETATMVTGIRGTCGWMEVVDAYTTRLVLLEGTVDVRSYDHRTGALRTTTVTGGQIITVVYHGESGAPGSEDIAIEGLVGDSVIIPENIIHTEEGLRVEGLREENVPEFVREEVKQSKEIQEKITEDTDLSVEEIVGDPAQAAEGSQGIPPESFPEVPLEPGDITDPQDPPVTPPEEAPSEPPASEEIVYGIPEVTEVYYDRVTVEWTEAVEEYPGGNNSASGGTGTSPSTPGDSTQNPGTGTPPQFTWTPPAPGVSDPGTYTPNTTRTVTSPPQYRPMIQLLPSETNPQYAEVTHAWETLTYEVTTDANGTVISSVLTDTQLSVDSSGASQTVPVQQREDGNYITFVDGNGGNTTLRVEPANRYVEP